MLLTSRRSFIAGLASLVAAPAIVRAENIMPVRALTYPQMLRVATPEATWRLLHQGVPAVKMLSRQPGLNFRGIPVRLMEDHILFGDPSKLNDGIFTPPAA